MKKDYLFENLCIPKIAKLSIRIFCVIIGLLFSVSFLSFEKSFPHNDKKWGNKELAPGALKSDTTINQIRIVDDISVPIKQNGKSVEKRPQFELVKGVIPADIVLAKNDHKGVMAAAKDLQRDITKITGVTPNIVHSLNETGNKCIVIGSADCPEGKSLLASVGVSVDELTGKWELFKYGIFNNVGGKKQVLTIAGSNVRVLNIAILVTIVISWKKYVGKDQLNL
ncbi:MAG: hypothetical protein PHI28_12240, partial [Mangrovibacterium sp.]|nr:hypothetical protein [Mangrovibacterium sp.]